MTDPSGSLTVAAAQAAPTPGDVAANAILGARLVAEGAERGARIVVLPELFLSAYHPPTLRTAAVATTHVPADVARVVDDARLEPLREACRQAGAIAVVGAAVVHADGRRTCSALVVDADKPVAVAYDKQNLWGPDEKDLFTPGDRGATLTVDGWRLALGICYDGCFPEHGRAGAVDGAHGYLCPSGYLAGSAHRRDLYYAARALDNTMYVAFANSVGGAPPLRFNGGAALYDPEGRTLARAADDGEAVVTATFDPAQLVQTRAAHTMLLDRPRGPGESRHQLA